MTASFSDSLAAEINSVSRSEVDLENITNSSVLSYSKMGFLISVVCVSSWWRLSTNRKKSTTGYRTTLTKSLWPSWSQTPPSLKWNRLHAATQGLRLLRCGRLGIKKEEGENKGFHQRPATMHSIHQSPSQKWVIWFDHSSVTECVNPPEHDVVLVTSMLFG